MAIIQGAKPPGGAIAQEGPAVEPPAWAVGSRKWDQIEHVCVARPTGVKRATTADAEEISYFDRRSSLAVGIRRCTPRAGRPEETGRPPWQYATLA